MSSHIWDWHQDLTYLQVSLVPQLPVYPTQLINISHCQLSQPTLWRGCEKAKIDRPKCLSPKEKTSGVATNIYLRKMLEKPKRGLWILKRRVWELFTHGEGISTQHTRHKGRQSLIECAKHDFKIMYFPILCLLFFWGRQGCCSCSYISSGAMRNSYLCSSSSLNVCMLNWFYVLKDLF